MMNKTPNANRLHIAIFGKRNVGKSSLINAISNQNLSIVSEIAGTTTDPVYKAMEIFPIGPVVLIDTAGIDDSGEIGELRIKKTHQVIKKTDLALLVINPEPLSDYDITLINLFKDNNIPFIIVINKSDLCNWTLSEIDDYTAINVSALNKCGIDELKNLIIKHSPKYFEQPSLMGDLIKPGDTVVLVIPIDSGMPKGRLILPEVQTIRDILDNDALTYIAKDTEYKFALSNLKDKPKIVVTDSQAFQKVSADTPPDILLTSFSILFARYKGDLVNMVKGAKQMRSITKGDKILISEACTHHAQPDDIGKVKIPRWIKEYISEEVSFDFCNGRDYPENLSDYKLIIHCAGCMLNRKEMLSRIDQANVKGIPIVNYGMAIAYMFGILDRALKPFPEAYQEWQSKEVVK